MATHPQLRALTAKPLDASAEHFFETLLPALFARHGDVARQLGGRLGFIVEGRQWVVDLDYARVRGHRHSDAVVDDDGLDVVVRMSAAAFEGMLRGKSDTSSTFATIDDDALARFALFLVRVT